MKPINLRVRLYVPNPEQFCNLVAHVQKGCQVQRKIIRSNITAPGSELIKFVPNGILQPGVKAPKWLQNEVRQFLEVATQVAQAYDTAGTLKETPSKTMTERAKTLLNERKAKAGVCQESTGEERG